MDHVEKKEYLKSYEDPVSYYKWPLALLSRGKKDEANEILNWVNKNCLSEEGDYISQRKGFHKEFHIYSTLWMTLAAIQLGEMNLVNKHLSFIHRYHNEKTGGVATQPNETALITEDPVTTAFLGMVACKLSNKKTTDKILAYFERLINQEIHNNQFWIRTLSDGSIAKNIPADADRKTYVIRLGQQNECYYFLGAICYFLGCYIESFTTEALSLAHKYASIIEQCGKDALSTIWAAKVAPGCAALYSVSNEKKFLNLMSIVLDRVIEIQNDKGYWMKDSKPWITVSAEQCYWLSDIRNRLILN